MAYRNFAPQIQVLLASPLCDRSTVIHPSTGAELSSADPSSSLRQQVATGTGCRRGCVGPCAGGTGGLVAGGWVAGAGSSKTGPPSLTQLVGWPFAK